MSEVEQTLRRIENNKSVRGTVVLDGNGKVIHSAIKSMDQPKYHIHLPPLIERARCLVRDLDPTNDLTFMRIRADKVEILVGPGDDYILIVIQDVVLIE